VLLGIHVAALDAFGQRDLEVGGEQRDAPDRAQVQPQRVQRRLHGQVELGLLRRIGVAAGGSLLARLGGRLDAGTLRRQELAVGADDVDALLGEVVVQFLDLLLGDLDLLESRGDLVEGQAAALLTVGDEAAKLVELVDRGLIRQQNLVVDRSAPLGPVPPRFAPTLGSVEVKRLVSDST
jgi:hypothetical protein